jgi:putative FmdB family regulatory protein
MPFYEYECQACKYHTEVMQKITDAPLTRCPSCGKRTLKKLVSAPVFRLKGSGWYETDFKSDKEGKRNLLAERDEAKPAAGGTENKTEAGADKETPAAKEPKESKESKESKDSKPAARESGRDTAVRGRVSVPVKGSAPAPRRAPRRGARTPSRKRRR